MPCSSGHQSSTQKGAEEVGSILVLPLLWEELPPQVPVSLVGTMGR